MHPQPTTDQLLWRIKRRVNQSYGQGYAWNAAVIATGHELQAKLLGYALPSMHAATCDSQRAALAHLSK